MSIPIPIGNSYSSTYHGSVYKSVKCCQCRTFFNYLMQREASGDGFSFLLIDEDGAAKRATNRAQLKVKLDLRDGCDPVPCPNCGTYQPNMVPKVQRKHLAYLRTTGIGFLFAAAFGFSGFSIALKEPVWIVPLIVAPIGIFLIILRFFLGLFHDPNAQPDLENRLALGRKLAHPSWTPSSNFEPEKPKVKPIQKQGKWKTNAVGLGIDGKGGVMLVKEFTIENEPATPVN